MTYGSRSRGSGPIDLAQLGPRSHRVGPPPDVLHVGERSPLDYHWRGAPTAGPLLALPPESPFQDPKCGDILLDGARAPHHP
jgi:hypothetical protein